MSLHPDIIDAMIAAGATTQMVAAACRAAWHAEANAKREKRAGNASRQRAKRQRDATPTPDLFEEVVLHDDQKFIDAALVEQAEVTPLETESRESRVTPVTKEIPPIPPKENTSSLRSSEVNVMERCPRETQLLVSEEARDIAEAIGREAGFEPRDTPPGWCGAANYIQAFLTQGETHENIRTAVTMTLRRLAARGRGPPDDFSYFRKPIASICADLRAPVPKVTERALEVISGGKENAGARAWRSDGRSRNCGSATDAASNLREYFARRAEAEQREAPGNDRDADRIADGRLSS
jgi:hypothetical protein